jgi:hypothetical protein
MNQNLRCTTCKGRGLLRPSYLDHHTKCPDCNGSGAKPTAPKALAQATLLEDYKYKWEITIEADSPRGAMDAVWHCWEAWRDGNEPMGMSCPASMGDRVTSRVKKSSNADISHRAGRQASSAERSQ